MITKPTKLFIILSLTVSSFALSHSSNAQVTFSKGIDARKLFVYNFMKYVFWPKEDHNKDFVISVVNNQEMYDILNTSFSNAQHRGRKIIVEHVESINAINESSIVYLPREESHLFKSIQAKVNGKPTLLITDQVGLGKKGSSINFKEENRYLKFEINMDSIENSHLKISSPLKKLAIII